MFRHAFFAAVFFVFPLACSNNDDEVEYDRDDRVEVDVEVSREHRVESRRGYYVHATGDPGARISGSVFELTPDGGEVQIYHADIAADSEFIFEQEAAPGGGRLEARFWVRDSNIEPVLVDLHPDEEVQIEILAQDGRLEITRRQEVVEEEHRERRVVRREHEEDDEDDDDDEDEDDEEDDDDDDDDRDDDDDDDD
ncbi:MAG TPA: hypothetical protein VNT79_15030 [Phycisphaerae bacterium]|nr:hypothetical protein [Phycisphaerae bacterium]